MDGAFFLYALLTLVVTRLASLGNHSQLHVRIARVAMGLEILLIFVAFGTYGNSLLWIERLLALGIAGCFFAVFITDDLEGRPWWKHALLKLNECLAQGAQNFFNTSKY